MVMATNQLARTRMATGRALKPARAQPSGRLHPAVCAAVGPASPTLLNLYRWMLDPSAAERHPSTAPAGAPQIVARHRSAQCAMFHGVVNDAELQRK